MIFGRDDLIKKFCYAYVSGRQGGVAFSPAGDVLATSSGDGTIRLWSVSTGKKLEEFVNGASVNCATFSPDGESCLIPVSEWTPAMRVLASYLKRVGEALLEKQLLVDFARARGVNRRFGAWYSPGRK